MTLVPGEIPTVVRDGARAPVGSAPLSAAAIAALAAEILPEAELADLPTSRPRVVRQEHDGATYVFEVVKMAAGIALSIRPAGTRPATRNEPAPPPASPPRDAGLRRSQRPKPRRSSQRVEVPRQAPVQVKPGPDLGIELDVPPARRRSNRPTPSPEPVVAEEAPRSPAPAMAPAPPVAAPVAPAITIVAPPRSREPSAGPKRIDDLCLVMIAKKASDLHLSAGNHPVLRESGEIQFLRDRPVLESADILALVDEIMTEKAARDFAELRDADFAYEVPGLARFRVNVFEDRKGVGAVLRQIPIDIIPAEQLGLPRACIDMCFLSKGLVVVTGPTGSGKSTTLAGMIDFVNKNRSDHIITIEDPVEFVHRNISCLVNQREVGLHTRSFKNALRAALREDPDIVLVGEMRDLETIAIAIETAETGHLVFGTLHTTTAVSTIDRIIDQFPADRQQQVRVMLSESLKGVVAQVLCKKIGGGRVAAQEILIGTPAVASMIREGKTFQIASVMQTSKNLGMVTMNDSLFQLVQKKLVEPKEAYIKAVDKSGLLGMFKNAGIPSPVG